jgi:heme-degrading monooxygenase HmoA
MILEHARLAVRPGHEDEFLAALHEAKALIARTEGFIGMEVSRCVEDPSAFLLLVEWETLEAHTVNFRESDDYQQWRSALHHFYDPMPTVEHFEVVEVA